MQMVWYVGGSFGVLLGGFFWGVYSILGTYRTGWEIALGCCPPGSRRTSASD
jgi:hypothetical protein